MTDAELEERARAKVEAGTCDLVVANDAARKGVAFGTDTNQVLIVGREGVINRLPLMSKRDVARTIVDAVVERLRDRE